jgi:putative ATPase
VGLSAGDARQALNVLEGAVTLAESEGHRDPDGRVAPTLADVENAAQQRVLAYDRAGDGHFDTVSAFIKSIRGNDADAALYWLASMIAAGEDPRFIARRLIISASEDVGNADPRALQVAVSAAQALDWVGLPEAQYALAQATVYLATAPKSIRSGQAYFAAVGDVTNLGSLPVPFHLRNAPDRRMKGHGIGVGYRYPPDYEGSDVDQQYLPDDLRDRRYFHPADRGYEATIAARMEARREARAAGNRKAAPPPGQGDWHPAGDIMGTRETNRRRLADTEKRDAGD